MKKLILIILSTLLITNIYSQENWKLKKSKNGINIYTRKSSESNIQEFKASVDIKAPMSEVYKTIYNADDYQNWVDQVSFSKKIKSTSKSFYVYYQIELPIGFRNRDIVLKSFIITKTDKKVFIKSESAPSSYPEQSKFVRIKKAYGYWLLLAKGDETKVSYQFYTDPGGYFPAWLINTFIIDGPYETLKNLKKKYSK